MYKTLHKKQGSVTVQLRFARSSVTFCAKRDNNSTVFYSQNWENEKSGDEKDILKEIIEDETLPRTAVKEINPYLFKTCLLYTSSQLYISEILNGKHNPSIKAIYNISKVTGISIEAVSYTHLFVTGVRAAPATSIMTRS